MGRKRLIDYNNYGLQFYDFLYVTNRLYITERKKLQQIYDEQFNLRHGYGFSTLLYSLKLFGNVTVDGQSIFFSKKLQNRKRINQRTLAHQILPDETNRPELIAAKIKIYSPDHRFIEGKMSLRVDINTEYTVCLYIKNTASLTVQFTGYKVLHQSADISLDESSGTPLVLHPDRGYEVCKVKFKAQEVGMLSVKLSFEFSFSTCFPIEQVIEALCVTPLGKELAPTAPYMPRPPRARTPPLKFTIVDNMPPQGMTKMRKPDYMQQESLRNLISALKNPNSNDQRKSLLKKSLSWKNFAQKFHLLLDLELHQLEEDIKQYNIPNDDQPEVTMVRDKDHLILKVPGVMEDCPSVQRWDRLLVYPAEDTTTKYCVYVDSVQQDNIKLYYNKDLLDIFVKGKKFNIEFTLNTLPFGIQRRAVKLAVESGLGPVLFPVASPSPAPHKTLPDLKLFDRKLEENLEQYRAVQHIVAGSSKPAPYLVFGPPGTGKTVTVAEAIKQIVRFQPKSHILACAPTNSAADQLCKNILEHVDKSQVCRIYAKYINPSDVPSELKACSNLKEDMFDFTKDFTEQELKKYKVIITTLLTSSRIVTAKVSKGHFTHVFVDEAGHCMETECLLPLAGLLNPETGQVVLAGDPKQLGPIIKSPFAQNFQLGRSLLKRLMTDIPLYQKTNETFDNRFVTKLLRNYRSHPDILKIPNELFYDGELEALADEYQRNSYCNWEELPQKGFPIIFHGVTSQEDRESSCPSFFNITEVEVLIDYVTKLLQTQGKKGLSTLSPQDIGIIAPYRKQVQKIRLALRKVEKDRKLNDISSIKVGSVEEFQGQERRVILVSTVRSSPDYTKFDNKFKLGFVKNKKRFNVALTRAKALLIVVGNPSVLRSDSTWERFIDHCRDGGGYRGF